MIETMLEGWTKPEETIAREAFELAYGRALEKLISSLRVKTAELSSAETVWELHDFLSIERHKIEGLFDFRRDGILFVFASLVKDSLLKIEELEGLDAEKLAKISAMSRF